MRRFIKLPRTKAEPSRLPFLLSGALALLAYPPINLWFVGWFALVPALRKTRSLAPGLAFRRGWWAGLLFNAGLLYWIALNSGAEGLLPLLSLLGMLLVMPLYWGAFFSLWALIWRRWGDSGALWLPAIWVGLEVVKNLPEIGFPWQELGLTQAHFLPAAQMAEIGGIRLVSAWVMAANVACFLLLDRRRHQGALKWRRRAFAVTASALAGTALWGFWRMHHLPPAGPQIAVVLVQGNVDPLAKWLEDADSSFAIYERLTRDALAKGPADLALFPETAIPSYLGHQLNDQSRLRRLARDLNTPILTGAPHYRLKPQSGAERLNSAFYFPADGSPPQRYDKIRMVPFGERVPFQRWFPQLGELNFGQAEFTPGKEYSVFALQNGVTIAPQICFESVFGPETRRFALRGARALCNMTNDAWYGNSSGPYQHADLVRFRPIETRYPLLRAANTGISLAVDRVGRVTDRIPWGVRAARTVRVESGADSQTFYVRHGELIPLILALVGLAGVLSCLILRSANARRSVVGFAAGLILIAMAVGAAAQIMPDTSWHNPGADTLNATSPDSLAPMDSLTSTPASAGVVSTLILPLALTVAVGAALLLLFLQRGN